MDAPAQDPHEESIGDLFGRLVEDGRAYARAEIDLIKQIARHRAARARNGLIMVAAGGVIAAVGIRNRPRTATSRVSEATPSAATG